MMPRMERCMRRPTVPHHAVEPTGILDRAFMITRRIRVLLWGMPAMLVNIIADTISSQQDMDVVSGADATASLADAAAQANADVVILVRNGEHERAHYRDLLYAHSRLKVIEISGEGRYGALYELRPRRIALGELSPPRLIDAVRTSVTQATPIEPV
jgi:DNA-binding NarL/FixJ family response regulator